jgi:capsular exopolysaccharide synthesis family protein
VSLRDFLLVLRARWRVIVAGTLLVVAATAAVTLTTTPMYTAHARFYLAAKDTSKDPENRGTYVVTTADLNTYVAVLSSPAVTDPLRERLGLPPGTPIDVSASVAEEASILDVTARSSDPQRAADIANAVGPQLADVADEFSVLLQATGNEVRATTISPATTPAAPTSPDVTRNLLLGVLAGLCLGTGLAFVRHTLDTKVRSDADIKALSSNPLLAGLPHERASVKGKGIAVEHDPHSGYAEAIRRLRTNLLFVDVTTGTHSFVITSAVPGEGKTTTAVNLALAMAKAGGRVLLVDADLRNPSVAKTMGLEESVGLTTVLLGNAAVDDVVQQWRDTDLFVLAAGQIPPNPSELLGSEPMQALFSKLGHEFDFVLVDSPPVVPVIDAVLIDKLTGGMLMVVASNRTRKRDLSSALRSLETAGAEVSGFALNFVPANSSDAGRYGYYRYEEPGTTKKKSRRSRRS